MGAVSDIVETLRFTDARLSNGDDDYRDIANDLAWVVGLLRSLADEADDERRLHEDLDNVAELHARGGRPPFYRPRGE